MGVPGKDDKLQIRHLERMIMVMLVDDQAFVAEMLQRQLSSEKDINFHYCQDPTQAISTAEKIGPTVILLDFTMPEIDGLTLCHYFRAHPSNRDIPIIMLSSNDDPATKALAFEAGANDYLVKLPDSIELIARLRYHSAAYINKLQRDDAYRALRASQMELEELNMKLTKLANIDSLTEVVNRRHFDARLSAEWMRAMRNRKPLTLVMFDIDLFKLYNDNNGHLEGDKCLKQVAHAVEQRIRRPADTVARYGGDEFIVLLPETDTSGAQAVAEALRTDVENLRMPNAGSTVSPYVTITLGVTTVVPRVNSTPDQGLKLVDNALYQAKEAGRNRISVSAQPPD